MFIGVSSHVIGQIPKSRRWIHSPVLLILACHQRNNIAKFARVKMLSILRKARLKDKEMRILMLWVVWSLEQILVLFQLTLPFPVV